MPIDAKKFAMLTSAMAASVTVLVTSAPGCTVVNDNDDDDAGGGDQTSSSSSGSSGETKKDSGASSSGGSSGGGSSSGGSSSGGTDGGADGGTCLSGGQAPAAAACEVVEGSATCNGDDYFTGMCGGARVNFAPAVAQAAIDCLSSSPICESDAAYACLPAAIADACDDASAVTFCEGLAAAYECDPGENGASPFTQADCVALAKAMTPAQRIETIGNCFDERLGSACTDDDVGSCFNYGLYEFSGP